MPFKPPPLPPEAQELCRRLKAHPRLVVHLQLVHECAVRLLDWLEASFPKTQIDGDLVRFGAATHDLGKTLHPEELGAGGTLHQEDGPGFLESLGVDPMRARFAKTHSQWDLEMPLEDLIVALADKVWKGRRIEALEHEIARRLAADHSLPAWDTYRQLDDFLNEIAKGADERIDCQRAAWSQRSGS